MNREPATLEPWYVTGLLEGQALFTFHRSGPRITVVFAIRLASAARSLLEAVRDFLDGAGRIYDGEPCYYRVTRARDLMRVVEHLDRYPLRGERRAVYEVWREMVLTRTAHHGSPGPPELDRLARELSRRTRRSSAPT